MRPRPVGALAMLMLAFLPAMALAQTAAACPEGRAPAGDLGIRGLRCVGPNAACAIFVADADGGLRHSFAVEPTVT